MTPLRAKYIRDLVIHGRSKHTQEAYTRYVCDLARYYRRSPELISCEEVTGWLYHLIKERQLSASSVNIAVSAEPCTLECSLITAAPRSGAATSLRLPRTHRSRFGPDFAKAPGRDD